jgi:hypothetical protein
MMFNGVSGGSDLANILHHRTCLDNYDIHHLH